MNKQQAEQQGYEASEQGRPKEANPYPPGTALHEWWHAGWSQAMDDLCGRG